MKRTLYALFLSLSSFVHSSTEHVVDQIVSVFENDNTQIQYSYIENLHDGRGYTAGRAGFTTANGDLLEVVTNYEKQVGHSAFHELIPTLKKRADRESSNVKGLEKLPVLWKAEVKNKSFLEAQDKVVDELYKNPARDYLKSLGLKTNLAYLIVFDTLIQHGDGNDPDSFSGVLSKMGSRPIEESNFLSVFLNARKRVLLNPVNSQTQREWRDSVGRVDALETLLHEGNSSLQTPFTIRVWGSEHRIK